jgi:hypothetical protein
MVGARYWFHTTSGQHLTQRVNRQERSMMLSRKCAGAGLRRRRR